MIHWYVTNGKDSLDQVDVLKDVIIGTGRLPNWNK